MLLKSVIPGSADRAAVGGVGAGLEVVEARRHD